MRLLSGAAQAKIGIGVTTGGFCVVFKAVYSHVNFDMGKGIARL
jgi:hypothetical protein